MLHDLHYANRHRPGHMQANATSTPCAHLVCDLLHAGPDNRSHQPRRFFGMSIARDIVEPKFWHDGYTPHPTLTAHPMSFGDLLDADPMPAPPMVLDHKRSA